jgi:hypothetical protein
LLEDVLADRGYDPSRVVLEALARLGTKTTQIPVYKYLRGAGFLTADGRLKDEGALPPRVVERVAARDTLFKGLAQYEQRAKRQIGEAESLTALIEACSTDDVLYDLPYMEQDRIDPAVLHDFLVERREAFDSNRQPVASQWAKAVCLYDWLAYGRG